MTTPLLSTYFICVSYVWLTLVHYIFYVGCSIQNVTEQGIASWVQLVTVSLVQGLAHACLNFKHP
jgi:isoprenylcysteine carboxyl methyltransferase (ICMT) family protein YpbQ